MVTETSPARKAATPAASKVGMKKNTARKPAHRATRPAAKDVVAPRAAAAAKPAAPAKARDSKNQIVQEIAETTALLTALGRKEVGKVLKHLEDIIVRHVSPKNGAESRPRLTPGPNYVP